MIQSVSSMLQLHHLFVDILPLTFTFIRQLYFSVLGQLVRPALQDSGDVRTSESLHTTQNTFSLDQGMPLSQVHP